MRALTTRQAQVLAIIATSVRDRGLPPTLKEIGNAMGIRSTNGVNDHLLALERYGYITREPMTARGIRLVDTPVTVEHGLVARSQLALRREALLEELALIDAKMAVDAKVGS